MHAGRQLQDRVKTSPLKRLGPLALLLLSGFAAGCVSDRYVGSIGRDGTYSNRGWGFGVRLNNGGLDQRWQAIDPEHLESAPPDLRPVVHDEPIDLDGDGVLEMSETTHYLTPTLVLASKTSSGAVISVEVAILGGSDVNLSIDGLVIPEIRRLAGTSSVAIGPIARRRIGAMWDARIAEANTKKRGLPYGYRVVLIDQRDFVAEENLTRRQLVQVVLAAPGITESLRRDLDTFVKAMFLSRFAGAATEQERW